MKIPYYIQQRITKRAIDIVMVIFLIITLFPIVWMVFSSFKSNTEILLGKIPFGRAGNDVISIVPKGRSVFVLTSDGGIDKFDAESRKISEYTSIKSMATNHLFDDQNIWVSTSDKGLVSVSMDDLSKKRYFDVKMKDLDINKIVSTMLAGDEKNIWFGIQQKGIEKLLLFDKDSRSFVGDIPLTSSLSPFQVTALAKNGIDLWIGTNKGLLLVDSTNGSILRGFNAEDINLPSVDIKKIAFEGNDLLLVTVSGLFRFSPSSSRIIKRYGEDNGLLSDRISSVLVDGKNILVGTNNGLSIINTVTGKITNNSEGFTAVQGSSNKGLVFGDVLSITKDGDNIYVGSSSGRISQLSSSYEVQKSFLAKEGHVVVRWRNYVDLWKNINFGLYLKNSIIICGITMLIAMIFATLAAYSLARFNFPGNNFFSIGVLATQMIPAIMYLIPIYIMFTKFTLWTGVPMKGTYFGLIMIYSAFFTPFSIWILRGFFAAIPVELEEAARIDGCSPFQVFWYIVLPLAVPGIIATGIYVFLTAWDELMFAWVLCNADTMTIPVGIRLFVGNYQNRFDLMMAAATVATIPVMILFFMLQKHIVKGLTAGAVKG